MVSVGYTLMSEQAGPKQLVDHAIRAEAAGFDQLVVSDHYYPGWTPRATRRTPGRCSALSPTPPPARS